MSTTVNFSTVTNSIAALSISGVTVRDVDEALTANIMKPATLMPVIDNFITGLEITSVDTTQENLDVWYTLNYRYIHCAVGSNVNMASSYSGMITNLAAIVKAFAQNETLSGAMNNISPVIGAIGTVTDGSGNYYLGCDISLRILQFLEV